MTAKALEEQCAARKEAKEKEKKKKRQRAQVGESFEKFRREQEAGDGPDPVAELTSELIEKIPSDVEFRKPTAALVFNVADAHNGLSYTVARGDIISLKLPRTIAARRNRLAPFVTAIAELKQMYTTGESKHAIVVAAERALQNLVADPNEILGPLWTRTDRAVTTMSEMSDLFADIDPVEPNAEEPAEEATGS